MPHSDLSPLNKTIYQVAPRSLVSAGLFITPASLSANSKKTFNRKKKIGKRGYMTRKASFSSKLHNEKRADSSLIKGRYS